MWSSKRPLLKGQLREACLYLVYLWAHFVGIAAVHPTAPAPVVSPLLVLFLFFQILKRSNEVLWKEANQFTQSSKDRNWEMGEANEDPSFPYSPSLHVHLLLPQPSVL